MIFLYFWVLIGLFVLFRSAVLQEPDLLFHNGFTVVNAWMLAKVTVVVDRFEVAHSLTRGPLIYPILLKSAALSVLLIGFYVVEISLIGAWHGKTLAESVPHIAGGGWRGPVLAVFIMFVGLIPFFAYRELARALGGRTLHALVFGESAEVRRNAEGRSDGTN